MTLTTTQALIIALAVTAGTMVTRFLPFLLFPDSRPVPKIVTYLGRTLPAAMMGLLVVYYNGPPVKTTREKIIVNQIIPYQPILSPEPPCYRSAQRNCPAEQGCLDRLGLAGTMALARCPQLLNPLRTLAAAAQPARTRLSRSVACDAKQLW